ncbi:plasmid mobilization protein [Ornithobacterium rhinotracheale]|uniref:plasmid mobilization protein n=1 Tax=Ornithobacterium rhinotracheale TaxID=28251 RepID=UPI001FF57338|nr:special sigma factor [Ornithobacterium rhinotracheale]MCK0201040.1 special sigma factor [Ornithobacterium rhinotracheale]UVD87402.1 special sigma factor [Ornithobacterium rhinotracheale]
MKKDFLSQFIARAAESNAQKREEETRKNFFKEIGRKGGLKRKNAQICTHVISVRFTDYEFHKIQRLAKRHQLSVSKYMRMVVTEKELKVNEFKTDEVLLSYGNHFIRIKNLLRNREWSQMANKQELIHEIDLVLRLMKNYLYEKNTKNE